MTNKYDWLLKKNLRSVDKLRLWAYNPRLDPEETYLTIRDFAEEITRTESDKTSFFSLVKSIANLGYIPGDPIVVWQNEENLRYYVAEGNRRILALKLLRNPEKAPKSIRSLFHKLSPQINSESFEKIPVCVAPTLEDAEWYISQRNSITSLQQKWSPEQQRRWISDLYEKYNGNLEVIKTKIDISETELQAVLRILKLKEKVKELKEYLTPEEYQIASSHRFPITTLERFFNFKDLREEWGIEFIGNGFSLKSSNESFLKAFAKLIERMLLPRGDSQRIDSRTLSTLENAKQIQNTLPKVISETAISSNTTTAPNQSVETQPKNDGSIKVASISPSERELQRRSKLKGNPNRLRLINDFYEIQVVSYRLGSLFNELKEVPVKYTNSVAASLRIFLDLAVLNYIETEKFDKEIAAKFQKSLRLILLSERIEFIKGKINDKKVNGIIDKLANNSNEFSLDVLNGYMHNNDIHYLNQQFINRFWDFLFPLFEKLVVIKEKKL